MGTVIALIANRPNPIVLTYTITTTVVAETNRKDLAIPPNLRVQIGEEKIASLYIHTVEFTPTGGRYAEAAEVAIVCSQRVLAFTPLLSSKTPLLLDT